MRIKRANMRKLRFALVFITICHTTYFAQTARSVNFCPSLVLNSPQNEVPIGFDVIVNAAGFKDDSKLKFDWSVSCGKIVEGQGTSKIKIKCDDQCQSGSKLKATVTVISLTDDCAKTASIEWEVFISDPPFFKLIDKYEIIPYRIRKERLDAFAIDLQSDENAQGVIAVSSGKNLNSKQINIYLNKVFNYLVLNRAIDAARLSFSIFSGDENEIELYVIPPGGYFPRSADKQKIIKGEDLIKKTSPKPKLKRKKRS